jgi:type VI protein secretion system component VasK
MSDFVFKLHLAFWPSVVLGVFVAHRILSFIAYHMSRYSTISLKGPLLVAVFGGFVTGFLTFLFLFWVLSAFLSGIESAGHNSEDESAEEDRKKFK